MPSSPTTDTIDTIVPYLEAQAIPASFASPILTALLAAGWKVTEADGTPLTMTDSQPGERVQVEGMPGTFVCGVKLGSATWLVWLEHFENGAMVRSTPVVSDSFGAFPVS